MLEKVGWPIRIACLAAAGMLFHPDILTDILGWVLLIAAALPHVVKVKQQRREVAA